MECPSRAPRWVLPLLVTVLAWAGGNLRADPVDPQRYAGHALAEALDDLRGRGLKLIYSSDLVRPDMIVAVDPPAGPRRLVLDRLLEPFGLTSQDGPGSSVLVVRSAPSGPPDGADDRRPNGSAVFREEIEVSSTASEAISDRPEAGRTLVPEQIREATQFGDDPNRAVARLPGVAAADRSAAFSIRGGEADETRFILDGLVIDDPFHLKDFLSFSSIIDSEALGGLELIS